MRAQHASWTISVVNIRTGCKSMIGVNARYIKESVEEMRAGVVPHGQLACMSACRWTTLWTTQTCIRLAGNRRGGQFSSITASLKATRDYRDLWRNPFLGRAASHPWGAMRAMGAFFGAGLMDRVCQPPLRSAGIWLSAGFVLGRPHGGPGPYGLCRRRAPAHHAGVYEWRTFLCLHRPARGRQAGQAGRGVLRRPPPHVQH